MAGNTNYKQIAVYKNRKALIEFMDDTRYEKNAMAWSHSHLSRIRINAKDYSEGTGENSVNAYYNFSPDEFYHLTCVLTGAKEKTAADYLRCKKHLERLTELKNNFGQQSVPDTRELFSIARQFTESENEIFSEAGQLLTDAIGRLTVPSVNENNIFAKLIGETETEMEKINSGYVLFYNTKILNYEKYINPENEKERQVTMLKVSYIPKYKFPYSFTVATGWGIPVVTKQKGVLIQEGSTRFKNTVNILLDEKSLFPMLNRVEVFLQAMATHALADYYETVTNPILFYQLKSEDV